MVGDGPDRGPARSIWPLSWACANTLFVGKQNHVERQGACRTAHVLLMPSEMESFGLAALEAMACAVVPIGTGCAAEHYGWCR